MANVTKAQLLTRLRRQLRDTADTVYSLDEKNESLEQAITDDPFVFKIIRDDSTTTVSGQVSYDLADNIQELTQLLVDVYDDGYGVTVDPGSYEVIDDQIVFDRSKRNLPAGHALIQIGKKKLSSTDSIPSYLAGYIIHTAAAYCLELLLSDKTGRFLKNDTSFAEIVGAINNHRTVAARYQRTLPNHNVVRF